MADLKELNEINFDQEVLTGEQPVLVDFWSPQCAPCRMMTPVLEELAAENAGSAKIVKVNVNDNMNIAMKYGANMLPTFILFKGGEPVSRLIGAQAKNVLQESIDGAKVA